VFVDSGKKKLETTRFDGFRPADAATCQVNQGITRTLLQGLALGKSLHYLNKYFHTTNRRNASFTFVMMKGQANDGPERLITSRNSVNRLIDALLQ
jgi:hypothetical protein